MKLKSLLASTAALAAIAIVMPAAAPGGWNPIAPAQAQNASFSFAVFYDGLAPHGDWVSYNGAYVFVPVNVGRHWRPYTVGHWVYTSDYGWMWVSEEPFGWATYHYGRWGFAEEIGWYWVPGSRWAPAWVSWRSSGSHVVWAPLPPSHGDGDVSVSISVNAIPDYYWVAVPAHDFLAINLSVVIIDNDRERRRIVDETKFNGHVRVRDNIVVNDEIDIGYIEEKTGKKVRKVKVERTDEPGSIRAGDNEVSVFTGNIEPERDKKPKKLKKIEEVKQNRLDGTQQSGDNQPAIEEGQPAEQTAQPAKKKEKIEKTQDQADQGQAVKTEKKKTKQVETQGQPDEQTGQPDKKKKMIKKQADQSETGQGQPAKKKNKQEQAKGEAQPGQPVAQKKGKKQNCDPATNAECPPEQQ